MLQLRERAFGRSVVRALSLPSHTDRQTMVFKIVPISLSGVLAAMSGLKDRKFTIKP